MAICLKVKGQKLSPSGSIFMAAGTLNYPEIIFSFDDEWTGFSKIATFCNSNSELYRISIKDDRCVIPAEVMVDNETVSIGVYGTKGNVRITTNIFEIRCHKSGYGDGINPSEQTADLLTQIQQEILEIQKNYLSKEQFRTQLQTFTTQVFGASCKVNYDGVYLKPLNGFRINKSDYNPDNGDVVVIWVNNEVLTPGNDYILVESEEDYWEVTRAAPTTGMYLTVQIWNIPKSTAGSIAGQAKILVDGAVNNAVMGIAKKITDEEEKI